MAYDGSPEAAPLSGLRVLLVEDDPDVREATVMLLEEEGARVTAIPAAEPALVEIEHPARRYDVMLTDVVLGEGPSGFDLAAAALARHPALPVLLVTGYAGPAGRVPPGLADAAPLLMKPYRRAELLSGLAAARQFTGGLCRAAA